METTGFGQVQWGSFKRKKPFSEHWGFDRGTPVDRYYIEKFLKAHGSDIHGRVLEVSNDLYATAFGRNRTTTVDVLDNDPGNTKATVIADLNIEKSLSLDSFDCIIFTQTLQLIYEVRTALESLHASLRTEGVLMITVPGITRLCQRDWPDSWFWSFTKSSLHRLLREFFPESCVRVQAYGNILTATSFLYGLAAEELLQEELEYHDPDYEVVIAGYAIKRQNSG